MLRRYVDVINAKNNGTDEIQFYYIMVKEGWDFPIHRTPLNIKNITDEMQFIMEDVKTFKSSSHKYNSIGRPYKRGYLIQGKQKRGKTTIVNLIAKEYNMAIYACNFNTADLDDSKLIQNISRVPPNSIILFDEFEKQYDNIKDNNPRKISDSCLLQIFDGIPSINPGCLIILTANDLNIIEDGEFKTSLLRPGRIDVNITFMSEFNPGEIILHNNKK